MRTLLDNARILDGTGAPAFDGAVLIEDEHLVAVGDASGPADRVIDLDGATVAPGFIDMHSHSDFTLPGDPRAEAKTLQGVTTEVVCNCGLGLFPANDKVTKFYELISPMIFGEPSAGCFEHLGAYRDALSERGVSVNVACLVPHGNVRCAAIGMDERAPTQSEMAQMKELVAEGMEHGAFGLSTGLIYAPGAFAETEEVIALAKVMEPYGGFYATHMRDEGVRVVEAVEEAIRIGREAGVGVQLSHHKAAGRLSWGKTKKTLALVDAARREGIDVSSDVYPYTAGSTVLSAMFVPLWAFEGSQAALISRLRDPATRERIIAESQERLLSFAKLPGPIRRIVPKRFVLPFLMRELGKVIVISSTRHQHHYEGMSLGAIAKARGQDIYDAIMDLLVEEETAVVAIAHVMHEDDVRRVMQHEATMIGTDGFPQREGKPHPRTFGTYPRVLEHYVREEGTLTLESAVHRMTGMVADKLGLRDRGHLRAGSYADVVVFDPARVHDRSSYEEPRRAPLGIDHVFVNGAHTVDEGEHTGALRGRVLRR